MTSHLDATGLVGIPPDLILGSAQQIDTAPDIKLVYIYGTKGQWAPGWYLLGAPAAQAGIPLAGPFIDEAEARDRWEQSKRWRLHGMPSHRIGFIAQSAMLFEPTLVLRPESVVLGPRSRVDSFCKLEGGEGLLLGAHVHIASFCHLGIGGGLTIFEDGSSAGSGARVLSGSASFAGPSWSATHPDVVNVKTVTRIRRNATLLVGCSVLPGCDIGEGATIGAGAVVTAGTKVPAGEVWVGVPARRLR